MARGRLGCSWVARILPKLQANFQTNLQKIGMLDAAICNKQQVEEVNLFVCR